MKTIVFVMVVLIAGLAGTEPDGSTANVEVRHHSGLHLVGPLDRHSAPAPEPLARAWSDASRLAEANPDAFGYPWIDRGKGLLILSVVTPFGVAAAEQWMKTHANSVAPMGRADR